jgi:hypothetical protein
MFRRADGILNIIALIGLAVLYWLYRTREQYGGARSTRETPSAVCRWRPLPRRSLSCRLGSVTTSVPIVAATPSPTTNTSRRDDHAAL